jgi:hypothetical protein
MPRFVLLYHQCPPSYVRASHWDLMLESGGALRTWALERLPQAWRDVHARTVAIDRGCPGLAEADAVVAEQLGDHRLDYLHLEGSLSGDRGSVVRVGEGTYHTESEQAVCWQFTLQGQEVSGCVTLTWPDSESSQWTLRCVPLS